MITKTKIKVVALGTIFISRTVNTEIKILTISVVELPPTNPFGRNDPKNSVPFDIEIHNNNIELFSITPGHMNAVANVELVAYPHRKDKDSKAEIKLAVNQIDFEL